MHDVAHQMNENSIIQHVINRPGVAGAVLQAPLSLIHSFCRSAYSFKSSKYHTTQTVMVRELTFWENAHPHNMSHVKCHVSHVMCHMSIVTCHVSHVMCNMAQLYIYFFPLFFWQIGEAFWWRVCYQWGLPRLGYSLTDMAKPGLFYKHLVTN